MLTIFGDIENPYEDYGYGKQTGLGSFINNILTTVMTVGGLVLFAMLIFGGFKYLTSGGNEDAVEGAQNTITYAVIGIAILIGTWFLVLILETVLGIEILHPVFKGP